MSVSTTDAPSWRNLDVRARHLLPGRRHPHQPRHLPVDDARAARPTADIGHRVEPHDGASDPEAVEQLRVEGRLVELAARERLGRDILELRGRFDAVSAPRGGGGADGSTSGGGAAARSRASSACSLGNSTA